MSDSPCNDNTDKLLREMKDWLQLPQGEILTIADCFRLANTYDKWRVDMFYTTFAPYMANILDDLNVGKGVPIKEARVAALKAEIAELLESDKEPLTIKGKQLINIKRCQIPYISVDCDIGDMVRDVRLGKCIVCKVNGNDVQIVMCGGEGNE